MAVQSSRMRLLLIRLVLPSVIALALVAGGFGAGLAHASPRTHTTPALGSCYNGYHSQIITYASKDILNGYLEVDLIGLYGNDDGHFCGYLASRAIGTNFVPDTLCAAMEGNGPSACTFNLTGDVNVESSFQFLASGCAQAWYQPTGDSISICAYGY